MDSRALQIDVNRKSYNFFEILIFSILVVGGIFATLHVGPVVDDLFEDAVFRGNLSAVQGLFVGDRSQYDLLMGMNDRYYGIGFHFLAYLFSHLTAGLIPNYLGLNEAGYLVTLKHIPVFLTFILSGFLIRQITFLVTNGDRNVSILAAVCFILWPYLLGHGFMNIKDAPFMFGWLLCTYQLIKISIELNNPDWKPALEMQFALLGLLTGWLLTIRISGVLIFIQYGIFLIIQFCFYKKKQGNPQHPSSSLIKVLALFFIPFFALLFLLYPIFWHDPRELLNAIFYQGHNPIVIDTLTAGNYISNRDVSAKYLFIWLSVKLPIILILGLILSPIILLRQTKSKNPAVVLSAQLISSTLISVISILLFLLINRVHLYNDLRHILFVFPLIFIVAIYSLFNLNKIICLIFLLLTTSVFAIDNLKLFPYQYTYLNEISRFYEVSEQFEKDYFFISAPRIAKKLSQETTVSVNCIYATPLHSWSYGINRQKYPCNMGFPQKKLDEVSQPFMLYGLMRMPNHPMPFSNCRVLNLEERSLFLSRYKLQMGSLIICGQ